MYYVCKYKRYDNLHTGLKNEKRENECEIIVISILPVYSGNVQSLRARDK